MGQMMSALGGLTQKGVGANGQATPSPLGGALKQFGQTMGGNALGVQQPPQPVMQAQPPQNQQPAPGVSMGDFASLIHHILFGPQGQSGSQPGRQVNTDDPGAPGY